MKITPNQWIDLVKLISTFIIGVITALTVQSCTASMSVFWKNSNSKQDSKQTTQQRVDSGVILPDLTLASNVAAISSFGTFFKAYLKAEFTTFGILGIPVTP